MELYLMFTSLGDVKHMKKWQHEFLNTFWSFI